MLKEKRLIFNTSLYRLKTFSFKFLKEYLSLEKRGEKAAKEKRKTTPNSCYLPFIKMFNSLYYSKRCVLNPSLRLLDST